MPIEAKTAHFDAIIDMLEPFLTRELFTNSSISIHSNIRVSDLTCPGAPGVRHSSFGFRISNGRLQNTTSEYTQCHFQSKRFAQAPQSPQLELECQVLSGMPQPKTIPAAPAISP
jgi:hypothetical protein